MNIKDAIKAAHALGVQHAEAAATWAADGNTSQEHIANVLRMLDEGDPAAEGFLPAMPNLSGEWADDLTPDSLLREIGADQWGDDPVAADAIASAYEEGVSERFEAACAEELSKWADAPA